MLQLTPSKILATAKRVDGEISLASCSMASDRFSAVSFNPTMTSEKRSVLAVHRTMTLSKAFSLQKWNGIISYDLYIPKTGYNKNCQVSVFITCGNYGCPCGFDQLVLVWSRWWDYQLVAADWQRWNRVSRLKGVVSFSPCKDAIDPEFVSQLNETLKMNVRN